MFDSNVLARNVVLVSEIWLKLCIAVMQREVERGGGKRLHGVSLCLGVLVVLQEE